MKPLKTDYISHDPAYQRLKARGASGWTSEADQQETFRPRVQQVLHRLALPPGSRILDLGCGAGDLAIWLAQQGYEVYGIDIAPTAIAWATEKALAQNTPVQFTTGNVVNLASYPDHVFQLVVDSLCLHCIIGPDRGATLTSVRRVLQPGGCLLVQTMCGEVRPASQMHSNFDSVSCCVINDQGIAIRYIGAAETILQELQTAGFQIGHWQVLPRQSDDDQDDLLAYAIA